jgi:hypothetical protein
MAARKFSILHDVTGAGVFLVIKRATDGYYWNGSGYQAALATIATTEEATLDSGWFEYFVDTKPTEYSFWWAYDSSNVLLTGTKEYDPDAVSIVYTATTPASTPTFTAGDAIKRALRLIGVLAAGEAPDANSYADALVSLQMMLDTWSSDSTLVSSPVVATHTLVQGTADYTIGPSGDITRARPTDIFNMVLRDGSIDYWVEPMTADAYWGLGKKDTGARPTRYLFEQLTTDARIRFDTEPDKAYTLYMYLLDAFAGPSAITDGLTYPPGYQEAIVYNLAVRLAPEYGLALRPDIVQGASSMLRKIRNRYVQAGEMVTGFEPREYDIYSDRYIR